MRIYFSGAIAGGRENLVTYQHIVKWLQTAGHEVPSAHVADPEVLSRESHVPPANVYERDMAWIEQSDGMVAEVSTPSLGVGYEICHALYKEKPVLCLYRRGLFISRMITGNSSPYLRLAAYGDLDELDAYLSSFLKAMGNPSNCGPGSTVEQSDAGETPPTAG